MCNALQVAGRKAMALQNLMEHMPAEALELVTQIVRYKMGGRVYLRCAFRRNDSKAWTARQTVTTNSCVLMLERI